MDMPATNRPGAVDGPSKGELAPYSVLKLNTCKVDEKKLLRNMVEAVEHCATVMHIRRQAFNLRYLDTRWGILSQSYWWPSHHG